jgi:hypothetical protein
MTRMPREVCYEKPSRYFCALDLAMSVYFQGCFFAIWVAMLVIIYGVGGKPLSHSLLNKFQRCAQSSYQSRR